MKKVKLNDENIHKGYLILINPDNLLKTNEIKLISYSEKYKNIELDQVANSQLQKALKSINANDEIVPISGVRTFEEQKRLYTDSIIENGEEYTKKFVALPNASEHQTGLGIDMTSQSVVDKQRLVFGDTTEYKWVVENCAKYGFIVRFTEGTDGITGISHEPWHLRYVGKKVAKEIKDQNWTLEEYCLYKNVIPKFKKD